jgi:sigma-B regulation protein RsbU (phosphoserine phosphatase)
MLTLNGYECITASGGKEAIALLESMHEDELPDVVLLDVMMPEMTGYEVCQRIREKYPVQTLPVIMLTAKREEKDIVKGFQSGANDYLTKPFYQDELTSRVNTLYMLKAAVRRDQQLLSLEKELEIARQMQASLLPKKTIEHSSYDISWYFRPMLSVGGDLIDVQESREGDLCFLIADVCGHGIGAAMVTSMVKLTFLMSHRLMHEPAAMLRQMNETLAMILGGTFVTAAVVHLSADGSKVQFARAGHPPLLHYQAQAGEVRQYKPPGKPMGDFPGNLEFTERQISVAPGDVLLLYTDGVTEAENPTGEMYGDRLQALLTSQSRHQAVQISQQLALQLDSQIAPKTEHTDDIAYVVIKVK